MPRTSILLFSIICLTSPTIYANDIVDFLRALQGPPVRQYQPVSARSRAGSVHHDRHRHVEPAVVDIHHSRPSRQHTVVVPSRSRVSLNISIGSQARVAQVPVTPFPGSYLAPGHGTQPPIVGRFGIFHISWATL